jgi:hypothetical protein
MPLLKLPANAETQSVWANRNAKIELENKSVEISNLIDAIKQYDSTVLPAANESLRIAELGYQAGKTSLLEFNSNKQIWLDKQLAVMTCGWLCKIKLQRLRKTTSPI